MPWCFYYFCLCVHTIFFNLCSVTFWCSFFLSLRKMKSSWCCQVFWSFCIEMLLCLCLLSTKYCFFKKLQLTLISFSFKLFSMNSRLAGFFFNVLKPGISVLLFPMPWFYRHSYMSFFPPSYPQHILLWRHFLADYLTHPLVRMLLWKHQDFLSPTAFLS